MLKPKLQYLGHLVQRTDSLEKTLMLGEIEVRRRRGWLLDGITDSMDMNLSKHQEIVKDTEPWSAVIHGAAKSQTWLNYDSKLTLAWDQNMKFRKTPFKTYMIQLGHQKINWTRGNKHRKQYRLGDLPRTIEVLAQMFTVSKKTFNNKQTFYLQFHCLYIKRLMYN